MLTVNNMDGLSLDGIMGMIRPFLPTISYYLNFAMKALDVILSYLGIELDIPTEEPTVEGEGTVI